MKAADFMTRHLVTVRADDTIATAISTMLERGISGLPVVDENGSLVGIVTEGDLLRRVETGTERKRPRWLEYLIGPGKLATEYVHSHGRKVEDVMTTKVVSIPPNATLADIVEQMERHRIKRIPIVDDGKLIGIVSRANLLHALVATASAIPETTRSDQDILALLWNEVEKSEWAPRSMINFVVRGGVVHLHGIVLDDRQRDALRTVAANIPGVKGVRDYLVWCEPTTGSVIFDPNERGTSDPIRSE